jgi:hypothetical protein
LLTNDFQAGRVGKQVKEEQVSVYTELLDWGGNLQPPERTSI